MEVIKLLKGYSFILISNMGKVVLLSKHNSIFKKKNKIFLTHLTVIKVVFGSED